MADGHHHFPGSAEAREIAEFQQELIGTPLERVRVLKKVGDGGFAQVYACELEDGRKIAVKRWNKMELTADMLTLFKREVQCIQNCNHPNVVKFYNAFLKPVSIVMEYVEGKSLFELIHSKQNYDWSFVRQAGFEMALAIEHVHSKGIIHRDLKSSNFLLDKTYHIKLCDFGLGRILRPDEKPTGGRGTPFWMAPEVIAHNRYATQADIYSYGVVLWELCSRATPFDDNPDSHDIMKIVAAVLQQGLRPTMPPGLPPNVEALIRRCWAADPMARPTWQEIKDFWRSADCIPGELLKQRVLPIGVVQQMMMQQQQQLQLQQQQAAAAAAAAAAAGGGYYQPGAPGGGGFYTQ